MESERGNYLFAEDQYMRQVWLMVLLYGTAVLFSGLVLYSGYVQFVLGKPFGNRPLSNTGLVIADAFLIVTGVILPIMVLRVQLMVRLDSAGLTLHYWPLTRRKDFPLHHIIAWEAQDYRPFRDYGGWGIRYSLTKKQWAYTVTSSRGVLLTLADGKKIMIGSERADELAAALTRVKGPAGGRSR